MIQEFDKRNTKIIAIAQEDKDLKTHSRILKKLKTDRGFEIVCDANRAKTKAYDRTTAYLIDRDGIVRQIFPMLIHHRSTWKAFLDEIDRLEATEQ